jgi:hypothetical protein
MAYPTLATALWEGWDGHPCTNDDCAHSPANQGSEPAAARDFPLLPDPTAHLIQWYDGRKEIIFDEDFEPNNLHAPHTRESLFSAEKLRSYFAQATAKQKEQK